MRRDRQDWNNPWQSESIPRRDDHHRDRFMGRDDRYDRYDHDRDRDRYGYDRADAQAQRDRGRDYAQNDTFYGGTYGPRDPHDRPRDPYFDRGYERERDWNFRERDERDMRYGADPRTARIGEDRQHREPRDFRDDRDFRDRESGRGYWDDYPWRSMTHRRR